MFSVDTMMPRKPEAEKRKPTGVSLEATLLRKAKAHAKRQGYGSLSALITKLLRDAVEDAQQAGEAQVKASKSKLRRR